MLALFSRFDNFHPTLANLSSGLARDFSIARLRGPFSCQTRSRACQSRRRLRQTRKRFAKVGNWRRHLLYFDARLYFEGRLRRCCLRGLACDLHKACRWPKRVGCAEVFGADRHAAAFKTGEFLKIRTRILRTYPYNSDLRVELARQAHSSVAQRQSTRLLTDRL